MISRDEWLKALGEAGLSIVNDPSALTVTEFAAMFGIGRDASRERLRRLTESGLAIATRKTIADSSGRPQNVRAFRLLDVNPHAKKRRKPS